MRKGGKSYDEKVSKRYGQCNPFAVIRRFYHDDNCAFWASGIFLLAKEKDNLTFQERRMNLGPLREQRALFFVALCL